MTVQINDTCFHRKINLEIVRNAGSGLFDPSSLERPLMMLSTACWRGYVAHDAILEDRLVLVALRISFSPASAARPECNESPDLFGVKPNSAGDGMGRVYVGFRHPVPFMGTLTLAHGFIERFYSHTEPRPPWQYRQVREVTFNAGRVTADQNRAKEMAAFRTQKASGKPWSRHAGRIRDLETFLNDWPEG